MNVKLKQSKHKDGTVALSLEYYINGKHQTERISITLDNPVDEETKRRNEERILLANQICAKREWEILASQYQIDLEYPRKVLYDFWNIFLQFIESYPSKDVTTVKASYRMLKLFYGCKNLTLQNIDKTFCKDFYHFLQSKLNGNSPQNYYKKFSMCLNQCLEKKMISYNPAKDIKMVHSNEITKEILDSDEIQRIAYTRVTDKYQEVKRAFLFACNTGLRWCDLSTLNYEDIDFENNMLHIVQRKVKNHSKKAILHLYLNLNALRILRMGEREKKGRVFNLHGYNYSSRLLAELVNKAGVNKHITFHCGRHSFITNIIVNGADIKTASELAGHSSIRHTEKYIHLVDKLKKKAVDSLPLLTFKD